MSNLVLFTLVGENRLEISWAGRSIDLFADELGQPCVGEADFGELLSEYLGDEDRRLYDQVYDMFCDHLEAVCIFLEGYEVHSCAEFCDLRWIDWELACALRVLFLGRSVRVEVSYGEHDFFALDGKNFLVSVCESDDVVFFRFGSCCSDDLIVAFNSSETRRHQQRNSVSVRLFAVWLGSRFFREVHAGGAHVVIRRFSPIDFALLKRASYVRC